MKEPENENSRNFILGILEEMEGNSFHKEHMLLRIISFIAFDLAKMQAEREGIPLRQIVGRSIKDLRTNYRFRITPKQASDIERFFLERVDPGEKA